MRRRETTPSRYARMRAKVNSIFKGIFGPRCHGVKAIRLRTTGAVVHCATCRQPVAWSEHWYRDPVTDVFYCQECRPAWSRPSIVRYGRIDANRA